MKAISEGNGSFWKFAVTLTSAIMVAGCFFWAASTFAQTLSVQSDATQSAQPDSIVQLTADAQGLPLLSPDAVPASGTFWLVMPGIDGGVTAPMPCPPKDTSFPIYQIANGQFLVDATGGQVAVSPQFAGQRIAASMVTDALEQEASSVVNLITRIQTLEADQQTRATMQAMGMDVPSPGDGGTNSFTPDGTSYIAPNYGTNLWIAQVTVLSGNLNGIGTNTQADIQYDIMSRTNLLQSDWQNEGSIYGSETTNWTPLTVLQNGRPILFLRLRSDADDGSGLPMWWQLQYFGYVGVNPNAPDPAGDGWSNYQKFQMGLNPNVFYTPPTPQGLAASYNANNSSALVSWQPSPGSVTGYTLQKHDAWTGQTTTYNLGTNISSFVDNVSTNVPDPLWGNILMVSYEVQAHYGTLGDSPWAGPAPLDQKILVASFIAGPQGSAYVAVPVIPAGSVTLQVTRFDENAWTMNRWYGGNAPYVTNFTIPISSSTNGLYLIPPSWCIMQSDAYGDASGYEWSVQTLNTNGLPTATAALYQGYNFGVEDNRGWLVPPYFDGRAQLKQNLIFLLRAAPVDSPFAYIEIGHYLDTNNIDFANFTNPPSYAYAGFYQLDEVANRDTYGWYENPGSFDVYWPFENNYRYRNFVFNSSELDGNGRITTGAGGNYYDNYIDIPAWGDFPGGLMLLYPITCQFQPPATSGATIPSVLATNDTRWLASYALDSPSYWLWKIGATNSGGVNGLFNNIQNWFGLPMRSVNIGYNAGSSFGTNVLAAGNTTTAGGNGGYFYPETAQPQFQTVEYDFWNADWPYNDLLPGQAGFSSTNTSRLLITSVGVTYFPVGYIYGPYAFRVNGYAKLAVTNGYNGVYGYLGQYFDKAYTMTNGTATTNITGVLSPYGDFFATQPGSAALVTMPDPDTGQRGTGTVYCVSVVIDRAQGSNMDLSFNGRDATSQASPMVAWANNNFDRWTWDADDQTNYQDDVQLGFCPYTPGTPTPDCNYRDAYGNRVIPCARDLQDFFRLWVCGITTNLLAALPAGSTVTLNWGDVGSPNSANPTIDLFQAVEANGGIGYLTNETIALQQINPVYSSYVGRLGPGQSVQLNSSLFGGWAGNHFIWCGVTNGIGQLNLTIADASGNVLAQASQWIQIVDIKQMYERWTVGDNPTNTPATTASLATENLPVGAPAFQYSSPQNTNTPYILFVHGWNMESWEKDRFAETAFKRLYWQGFQGRFGEFRWPTGFGFSGWQTIATNLSEKDNFDSSEYQAWQSAIGLTNLLTHLNAQYPGRVYLLAHSMGNVVAGEALRLAGSSQVVNTYIASQAAVSAHTYDENTNDIPNYSFYYPPWSLVADTPNIYGNWFAGNNGGGAGRVISFYNTHDYALQRSVWQRDELLKPDQYVLENGIHWDYGYDGSVSDPPPWNDFFKQQDSITNATVDFDIVNNLNNRYEVMGYAAQSYTIALGATPVVQNVAATTDLTALWPSPDPLGNNYTSHFFHSAEFRGDSVWEWNYWNTLLFSRTLGFNINNQ